MATLNTPRFHIILEQSGTDDLMELEVQTDNRDAIQWDVTRGRRKWPTTQEAPMLWATFMAWHAMKRTNAPELAGMDLDAFLAVCLQVRPVKETGESVALEEASKEDFMAVPTEPVTPAI